MKELIIILFALSFLACKNGQKTTETKENTTSKEMIQTQTPDEIVFDVIAQFISKGEGIAHAEKVKFEDAVANFNKTNHTNIEADERHWGREGETDLNYDLKNLSTVQKKSFISLVNELASNTDMIQLKFNEKGVQKR